MTRTDTLLILVLIVVVFICGRNYIDGHEQHVHQLEQQVSQQQKTINEKTRQLTAMSQIIESMYYAQTGKRLPDTWHYIPKKPDKQSPVH